VSDYTFTDWMAVVAILVVLFGVIGSFDSRDF
jgi:hypothetical protein